MVGNPIATAPSDWATGWRTESASLIAGPSVNCSSVPSKRAVPGPVLLMLPGAEYHTGRPCSS
jgi:hypothetical protein